MGPNPSDLTPEPPIPLRKYKRKKCLIHIPTKSKGDAKSALALQKGMEIPWQQIARSSQNERRRCIRFPTNGRDKLVPTAEHNSPRIRHWNTICPQKKKSNKGGLQTLTGPVSRVKTYPYSYYHHVERGPRKRDKKHLTGPHYKKKGTEKIVNITFYSLEPLNSRGSAHKNKREHLKKKISTTTGNNSLFVWIFKTLPQKEPS